MKVKVLTTFKDIKEKKLREVGEEFECTKERYEEIRKVGNLVEIAEKVPEEAVEDTEVKREPEEDAESAEVENEQVKTKKGRRSEKAKDL